MSKPISQILVREQKQGGWNLGGQRLGGQGPPHLSYHVQKEPREES